MHKSKNMLVKLLMLFFVLAVGVFVLTVAWFTNSQTATASGLSVSVHKDLGLQISDDRTNWTTKLTYPKATTTSTETTTEPISLPLVTSSDGINFKKPLLHMTTGEPVKGSGNVAADKTDYIEKTIYFRSDKPMTVSLSKAEVTPCVSNEELQQNLDSKSAYGEFSKDYIAAAARISITKGDTTKVYDPNPNIELKNYGEYTPANDLTDRNIVIFTDDNCYYALTAKEDNSLSDIPISMNSTDSTTYKGSPIPEQMFVIGKNDDKYTFKSLKHSNKFLHYNSTEKKFDLSGDKTDFTIENGSLKVSDQNVSDVYLSYDGNSFVALEKETAPTTATVKMLTSAPCTIYEGEVTTTLPTITVDLSGTPDEDGFYKNNITLRIWAEGTDRDALVPLMGGKFKTEIEFSGTVTQTP